MWTVRRKWVTRIAAVGFVISTAVTAFVVGRDQLKNATVSVDPLNLPIQFSIGMNGDISVSFSVSTPPNPLGRVTLDIPIWSNREQQRDAILKKDTLLVIEHDVAGTVVRTGRDECAGSDECASHDRWTPGHNRWRKRAGRDTRQRAQPESGAERQSRHHTRSATASTGIRLSGQWADAWRGRRLHVQGHSGCRLVRLPFRVLPGRNDGVGEPSRRRNAVRP